ncbi:hypothetical protein [Companilactobacillus mishanensis]|uniref:hypothetical protein n=1 Tax=Companilactobacillus mishanensis TaxID=2486008 RepID=UPI001296E475|nr:hypothetical protein [Companilactobacillus mishanensis]MQS88796.1 hypothetical protein [Companilactobacillus mishanensis]
MINLWLKEINGDIVKYTYQADDSQKGEVLYSKKIHSTKIMDDTLDGFHDSYYKMLHNRIMIYGKNNKFPKTDIIAWY